MDGAPQRQQHGSHHLHPEGGYGITAITDPRYFVPIHGQSIWGNGWNLWYLEPNNPELVVPPQEIQDHIDLYERVLQAPTSEERLELMGQVYRWLLENLHVGSDQKLRIPIPPMGNQEIGLSIHLKKS